MRGLVCAGIAAVAACGGGGDGGGVDAGSDVKGVITYDFNGSSYSASFRATANFVGEPAGGNTFGMVATDGQGHDLSVGITPVTPSQPVTAGTYDVGAGLSFGTSSIQFIDGSDGTWQASSTAGGSGSFTITLLTTIRCMGTFEATMVGSGATPGVGPGALTNGTFDVNTD